jgi:NADH:ubiquinone oxidoreductase subunit
MGMLKEIFCWWDGNTWGTRFFTWRKGKQVGNDEFGNRYFLQRKGLGPLGVPARWVIYKTLSEASQVPPDWHGWLHYTVDELPTSGNYQPRPWQKQHQMNMTGTPAAYRPQGSILSGKERPAFSGDYKAWKPN